MFLCALVFILGLPLILVGAHIPNGIVYILIGVVCFFTPLTLIIYSTYKAFNPFYNNKNE